MALYIGKDKIKRKVYINGIAYKLRYGRIATVNGSRLLSSDGLTLCDANGVYILVKDGD